MYYSTHKKHSSISSMIAVVLVIVTLLSSCGTKNEGTGDNARKNMSLDEMVDTYIYTLGTTDRSTIESLYLDKELLLITIGGEEELWDWLYDSDGEDESSRPDSYTKFDIITVCDEYYVENEGYTVLEYEKIKENSGSEALDVLNEDYNFGGIDVEVEDAYTATYNVEVECDGYITDGNFWIVCAKIDGCWYIVDTESYMFEEDI